MSRLGPQFRFVMRPATDGVATITAHDTSAKGDLAGYIEWDSDELRDVMSMDNYQRKGLATELWKKAQQAHKESPFHYPEPKPSVWRTRSGDQWSQSLHARGLSPTPPPNQMTEEDEQEFDR